MLQVYYIQKRVDSHTSRVVIYERKPRSWPDVEHCSFCFYAEIPSADTILAAEEPCLQKKNSLTLTYLGPSTVCR